MESSLLLVFGAEHQLINWGTAQELHYSRVSPNNEKFPNRTNTLRASQTTTSSPSCQVRQHTKRAASIAMGPPHEERRREGRKHKPMSLPQIVACFRVWLQKDAHTLIEPPPSHNPTWRLKSALPPCFSPKNFQLKLLQGWYDIYGLRRFCVRARTYGFTTVQSTCIYKMIRKTRPSRCLVDSSRVMPTNAECHQVTWQPFIGVIMSCRVQ